LRDLLMCAEDDELAELDASRDVQRPIAGPAE
jgi:hypothetical protein